MAFPHKLFALAAILIAASAAAGDGINSKIFTNGLPAHPSYFPIGVAMQQPRFAPEYQAIGVNVFVGLWKGPREDQLSELAKHGMSVLAAQNEVGLTSPNAKLIRGWLYEIDEPDNAQPKESGFTPSCVPAHVVAARVKEMKARDPTRPVMIGFGRGVADPSWIGRGFCTGDMGYYDKASVGADILAFDIYPVASNALSGRLEAPSLGVLRLRAATKEGQQVWPTIETTHIGSPTSRVTPAQLKSEVWLAIIRGANGIIYFAHEWTGGFREDGMFRYPDIVEAVKETNALIRKLAPVINSPTVEGEVAASGTVSPAIMLKRWNGATYLFAGSTDGKPGVLSFALKGVASGRAEVIGENRELAISKGVLVDSFDAPYAVHIYRITTARDTGRR